MAGLIDLKHSYDLYIKDFIQLIHIYNRNLKNELFEKEPNETDEETYKRGETLFDKLLDDSVNLNNIISKEDDVLKFFEICKMNQEKFIQQKNELITKLLRIKKKSLSKEDYLNIRDIWNKLREETLDERNRRECEEML